MSVFVIMEESLFLTLAHFLPLRPHTSVSPSVVRQKYLKVQGREFILIFVKIISLDMKTNYHPAIYITGDILYVYFICVNLHV